MSQRKKAVSRPTTSVKSADPKLSCLDAAVQVLKAAKAPMSCKEMINTIFAQKLWQSDAPTPVATLSSAIGREMKIKQGEARFRKTERGRFALND